MERIVQRFSVVYVTSGRKTKVFRSLEEMPEDLRQKLIRTARTSHVDTLIIANEKGRELLQSQGLPRQEPVSAPPPAMPAALRWILLLALTTGAGLLVTWLLEYR
ncbi:MAG: hypothetical protein HY235_09710 [Acidobacteria bacterium]|nr:hypothetical protein [Acidobacteriota bacterium]